jgi:hypothetical protein
MVIGRAEEGIERDGAPERLEGRAPAIGRCQPDPYLVAHLSQGIPHPGVVGIAAHPVIHDLEEPRRARRIGHRSGRVESSFRERSDQGVGEKQQAVAVGQPVIEAERALTVLVPDQIARAGLPPDGVA